jgi:hypothetical protein
MFGVRTIRSGTQRDEPPPGYAAWVLAVPVAVAVLLIAIGH